MRDVADSVLDNWCLVNDQLQLETARDPILPEIHPSLYLLTKELPKEDSQMKEDNH